MSQLLTHIVPELVLTAVACVLLLLGCARRIQVRRILPWMALVTLVAVFFLCLGKWKEGEGGSADAPVYLQQFSYFIRTLSAGVAVMLLLLAWPDRADAGGNSAMDVGEDAGEFYGLFLLSIAGLLLTCAANDLVMLFLALELVSIPTYIMVSMSRRAAVAQEAGVKYFFLGAMSVAIMLFGFSYLYGTTGEINLSRITQRLSGGPNAWQLLALVMVMIGFAFKMAAFPLHFYAGDVYEGAATPVTAFLAFVPKTAGFVALIKLLMVAGGPEFVLPEKLDRLLWVMAALTMSVGNVLALLQSNVKRVLAYSSIAHSGYMLVGAASLHRSGSEALQGILFYLAAYGLMNAAAFGVLMLLPSRDGREAAETFEDLAGQGRQRVGLGLAMAVACFSLIGLPLTVGFIGKLLLIKPALAGGLTWLAVILVINAAVSAAYYLRIVATMFLRTDAPPLERGAAAHWTPGRLAIGAAVMISVLATLLFGTIPGATRRLAERAGEASRRATVSPPTTLPVLSQR